jgi:cobalt transporter subunit CbtA
MFRRIFLTALIAGAIAGLFDAGLQQLRLIPLIERAEVFESAAAAQHEHAGMAMEEAWEPTPGLERNGLTVVADILAGIGFALVLTGAITLAGVKGYAIDMRRGMLWGAAGFAVFVLAPALGLPPEPPGMEAAPLIERQAWWIATAVATALALGLFVFMPRPRWRIIAVALLLVPHLIGAPQPPEHGASVPPDIAAQFVVSSLATAALFWVVLGGVTGWLYRRLA